MFIKRVLLTSVLGMVMTIVGAVAVTPTALDKRTPSSKAYVDTEVETKQIKIPAAGQPNVDAGETVITYTAAGNGTIGERALYSDASVYNATTDADKLITASALNDTFTNLPTTGTTKLECANPGTCNLWTIVDQTAYGFEPNILPKTTASANAYFIPQADGSVVCQGTPATYVSLLYLPDYSGLDFTKTYTFGFFGEVTNARYDVYIRHGTSTLQQYIITPSTPYMTINFADFPTADRISVTIARNLNNVTMSGTMYPYIVEGSTVPTVWHEYGVTYTDGTGN